MIGEHIRYPRSAPHKISFQFKNDVEVLFQGNDRVLHVLNDYLNIFSLSKPPASAPAERYIITLKDQPDYADRYNLTGYHFDLIRNKNIEITCNFSLNDPDYYVYMLMIFSMLLGSVAQHYGGGLMHAALGEFNGKGFLMAAPGGTGKSTASSRLPAPFISHCDDTTLVVKDKVGNFWAHPFPTWSYFYWGGAGGSWKFDHALPFRSIFFLSQSETDFIFGLNPAEKVSCCVSALEQASHLLARTTTNKDKLNSKNSGCEIPKRKEKDWFAIGNDPGHNSCRELRMQWFENALIMSKQLPAFKLNLSLQGNFWELIKKYL